MMNIKMMNPRSKPRQRQKQQKRQDKRSTTSGRTRSSGSSSSTDSSSSRSSGDTSIDSTNKNSKIYKHGSVSQSRHRDDGNDRESCISIERCESRPMMSIFDITSAADTTSFSSAIESVILSPLNGLTSAVREVVLATEEALSVAGAVETIPPTGAKPTDGGLFTGSAGSRSLRSARDRLGSIKEKCYVADENKDINDEKKIDDHEDERDCEHARPAMNIHHIQNGSAEVELLADDDRPFPQVIDATRRRPMIVQTENRRTEPMTMSLRVLRANRLSFKAARVKIRVLDEHMEIGYNDERVETDVDGRPVVEKDVGCTFAAQCPSGDPIWGGPEASFSIRVTGSSKLLFTLEDATAKCQDSNQSDDDNFSVKSRVWVKVYAKDLLNDGIKQSPNCWLRLMNDNGHPGFEDYGHLEVRLMKTPEATLHEQENCRRITSGPNLLRMQSYAIRKLALFSVAPVILNVYDVSNNKRIQQINNTTKPLGYGGIFHAAIEIHGREYTFGGTHNKQSEVTGIFSYPPKRCPMHHYRESVYLGDCELGPEHVRTILEVLSPHWKARTYNLFRKNCAFFSRELAIQLGVGDIPEWVWSLASTAEKFEPTLLQIHSFLRRPRNADVQPASEGSSMNKSDESEGENGSDRKDLNMASSTQENLLDHAMAARIQRGFRASSSRGREI